MKTSELSGTSLDWAVSQAARVDVKIVDGGLINKSDGEWWQPSADWAQGGPIIERERIELRDVGGDGWAADDNLHATQYGDTPLIAAMRCFVASKLGEDIEVPAELNWGQQ